MTVPAAVVGTGPGPDPWSEPARGVRVRDATAGDDAAIADLLVRAFTGQDARRDPPTPTSARRLAELRDQPRRRRCATVLVAERGGTIMGTVCLLPPGATGSEAWIERAVNLRLLATDRPFQGQGISAALLDESEARARRWNATAICLHVHRPTPSVATLYLARGYARAPDGDLDLRPDLYLEGFMLPIAGG